jgi:hypothetical protein
LGANAAGSLLPFALYRLKWVNEPSLFDNGHAMTLLRARLAWGRGSCHQGRFRKGVRGEGQDPSTNRLLLNSDKPCECCAKVGKQCDRRPTKGGNLAGFRDSAGKCKRTTLLTSFNVFTPETWKDLFNIFYLHYAADLPFLHEPSFLPILGNADPFSKPNFDETLILAFVFLIVIHSKDFLHYLLR